MNKFGYAWGVLGFFSGTQISEGSNILAMFLAFAAFVCLIFAISNDKN